MPQHPIQTRLVFFILLLSVIPATAGTIYTVIDGRWYNQASAEPFGYFDGLDWYLPGAAADNCYRSDGQAQQFGWMNAFTSFNLSNVYDVKWVRYRALWDKPGSTVLSMGTESGTVRCSGQIAPQQDDHIFSATFGNRDWLPPLSSRITIKLTGPNVPPGCKFYTNPAGLAMYTDENSKRVAKATGVWDTACYQ
jgi:hypothetical protein